MFVIFLLFIFFNTCFYCVFPEGKKARRDHGALKEAERRQDYGRHQDIFSLYTKNISTSFLFSCQHVHANHPISNSSLRSPLRIWAEEEPYRQPSVLFLSYPLECSDSLISTISSKPQHFPLSIPCRGTGTVEWSGKQLIMDLNVFRGKRMINIWLALAVFPPIMISHSQFCLTSGLAIKPQNHRFFIC